MVNKHIRKLQEELNEIENVIKNTNNKNIKELNEELALTLKKEIKIKEQLRTKGYKSKLFNKVLKKFEKYEPQMVLLRYVKYVGHKILSIKFRENKYLQRFYTVKSATKITQDMSNYLKKKKVNGLIGTALI